jgi:hypothetical protein
VPSAGPMEPSEIEDDVRAFLRQHIETYEELEVLTVMHHGGDVAWIAEEVAAKLRLSVLAAQEILDGLTRRGILEVGVGAPTRSYRVDRRDPARAALVERVARAYVDSRLAIVKLMTAHAIDRMRTSALERFSDAFLLGGRGRDD